MKKLILFLSALGLCFGCAQSLPPGGQTQEAMISACRAYDSALTQLAAVPLSPSDIDQVNTVRAIINPICISPVSYQIPGLLQNVETETQRILSLYGRKAVKP